MGLLGDVFDGLSGGLGTALGGVLGFAGQKETNEANAQQAQLNRDFQERMSSTSYQRAVKDMEAAGLNPMLAYQQGGSSTPGGSQAAPMQNALGAGVSSASQASSTSAALQQVAQSKATVEQTQAQTEKIKSETLDNNLNSALVASQIGNLRATALSTSEGVPGVRAESQRKLDLLDAERYGAGAANSAFAADVAKRKAESSLSQLEVPRAKAEAEFYQGLGKDNPYLKMILDVLRAVGSARSIAR